MKKNKKIRKETEKNISKEDLAKVKGGSVAASDVAFTERAGRAPGVAGEFPKGRR